MKKLICLVMGLFLIGFMSTPTLAADKSLPNENGDYMVTIKIVDTDPKDYLSIPDVSEIDIYVQNIDTGVIYKFPITKGDAYFTGMFPLPAGTYQTIPDPNAKTGTPVYLSDMGLKIPNDMGEYKFDCTITEQTEPQAQPSAVAEEAATAEQTPTEPKEESGFKIRYSQIVTILAIAICIVLFFYSRKKKKNGQLGE